MQTTEEFTPSKPGDFATVPTERKIGRVPILLVRMNSDLAMGDVLLKKTGSANLFMVFGEPDIAIEHTSDGIVVEIRGVDVYNPTTGEIPVERHRRDRAVDDRHRLRRGVVLRPALLLHRHGNRRLTRTSGSGKALKADIDEAAWAVAVLHPSRPFPRPRPARSRSR